MKDYPEVKNWYSPIAPVDPGLYKNNHTGRLELYSRMEPDLSSPVVMIAYAKLDQEEQEIAELLEETIYVWSKDVQVDSSKETLH